MILAVVRSHYGNDEKHLSNTEKVYRAGNALAEWLGLYSWVDIVIMQNPENVEKLKLILSEVK